MDVPCYHLYDGLLVELETCEPHLCAEEQDEEQSEEVRDSVAPPGKRGADVVEGAVEDAETDDERGEEDETVPIVRNLGVA